jgi:phosphoribosylformimino-5-aminoimidazole carboxamide ribotide isomerase
VVIGTLALTEKNAVQAWLAEFGPSAITLAFDVKADDQGVWRCASHGWTELSTDSLDEVIAFYRQAGLRHVLCTDIARDGLLGGYNLDLYRHLQERWPELQVQASGGVSSLNDIRAVKALGVSGAILGRALLEGKFTLGEALAC